jgi:hypothetical protein
MLVTKGQIANQQAIATRAMNQQTQAIAQRKYEEARTAYEGDLYRYVDESVKEINKDANEAIRAGYNSNYDFGKINAVPNYSRETIKTEADATKAINDYINGVNADIQKVNNNIASTTFYDVGATVKAMQASASAAGVKNIPTPDYTGVLWQKDLADSIISQYRTKLEDQIKAESYYDVDKTLRAMRDEAFSLNIPVGNPNTYNQSIKDENSANNVIAEYRNAINAGIQQKTAAESYYDVDAALNEINSLGNYYALEYGGFNFDTYTNTPRYGNMIKDAQTAQKILSDQQNTVNAILSSKASAKTVDVANGMLNSMRNEAVSKGLSNPVNPPYISAGGDVNTALNNYANSLNSQLRAIPTTTQTQQTIQSIPTTQQYYDVDSALKSIYNDARSKGVNVSSAQNYGTGVGSQAQAQQIIDGYYNQVQSAANAAGITTNTTFTYDNSSVLSSLYNQAKSSGLVSPPSFDAYRAVNTADQNLANSKAESYRQYLISEINNQNQKAINDAVIADRNQVSVRNPDGTVTISQYQADMLNSAKSKYSQWWNDYNYVPDEVLNSNALWTINGEGQYEWTPVTASDIAHLAEINKQRARSSMGLAPLTKLITGPTKSNAYTIKWESTGGKTYRAPIGSGDVKIAALNAVNSVNNSANAISNTAQSNRAIIVSKPSISVGSIVTGSTMSYGSIPASMQSQVTTLISAPSVQKASVGLVSSLSVQKASVGNNIQLFGTQTAQKQAPQISLGSVGAQLATKTQALVGAITTPPVAKNTPSSALVDLKSSVVAQVKGISQSALKSVGFETKTVTAEAPKTPIMTQLKTTIVDTIGFKPAVPVSTVVASGLNPVTKPIDALSLAKSPTSYVSALGGIISGRADSDDAKIVIEQKTAETRQANIKQAEIDGKPQYYIDALRAQDKILPYLTHTEANRQVGKLLPSTPTFMQYGYLPVDYMNAKRNAMVTSAITRNENLIARTDNTEVKNALMGINKVAKNTNNAMNFTSDVVRNYAIDIYNDIKLHPVDNAAYAGVLYASGLAGGVALKLIQKAPSATGFALSKTLINKESSLVSAGKIVQDGLASKSIKISADVAKLGAKYAPTVTEVALSLDFGTSFISYEKEMYKKEGAAGAIKGVLNYGATASIVGPGISKGSRIIESTKLMRNINVANTWGETHEIQNNHLKWLDRTSNLKDLLTVTGAKIEKPTKNTLTASEIKNIDAKLGGGIKLEKTNNALNLVKKAESQNMLDVAKKPSIYAERNYQTKAVGNVLKSTMVSYKPTESISQQFNKLDTSKRVDNRTGVIDTTKIDTTKQNGTPLDTNKNPRININKNPRLDVTKLILDTTKNTLDTTKNTLDTTKNTIDTTKNTTILRINVDKRTIDTTKQTIDTTKRTAFLDIGKRTIDIGKRQVGKQTIDLNKNTIDLGKQTIDLNKNTIDLGKQTIDLRKNPTVPDQKFKIDLRKPPLPPRKTRSIINLPIIIGGPVNTPPPPPKKDNPIKLVTITTITDTPRTDEKKKQLKPTEDKKQKKSLRTFVKGDILKAIDKTTTFAELVGKTTKKSKSESNILGFTTDRKKRVI